MADPANGDNPEEATRPRPRRRSAAVAASPPPSLGDPSTDGDGGEAEASAPTEPTSAITGLKVAKATSRPRRPRTPPRAEPTASPGAADLPEGAALAGETGPSGLDGIPASYDDGVEWLRHGLHRHRWGVLVALVFGWTGVWLALWGAVIGVIAGVLFGLGVASSPFGNTLFHAGAGQAVTILSVVSGAFLGAVGGFVYVLRLALFTTPWQFAVALASGAFVAMLVVLFTASFERLGLRLRGYRRLSRDEVRRVAPLVRDVAEGMNLDGLPRFAITDVVLPNAWSHMRTVVITSGLLQTLDDAELRAVLAHELHHWRTGDSVGLHIVWAAAWPVALVVDFGLLVAGRQPNQAGQPPARYRGLLVLIGWVIAWPAWVILKLGIAPVVAGTQRRYEYEADAAAASLGYAPALITGLRKIGAFEGGRTGWEQAMSATHPPLELRIEALQAPKPDDAQYQESELTGPSRADIARLLRALWPPYHRGRSSSPS
ncbi:MAG: M48 family metalloprotease [Acidimicrobiales bacterium]